MKVLFLATEQMTLSSGISKKTMSQCEGLKKNGAETHFCCIKEINDYQYYVIDDKPIAKLGKEGIYYSIAFRLRFNGIYKYIRENKIEAVYIRYVHIGTPFMTIFFRKLKAIGVRIILEIPTYPYDIEYKKIPLKKKILVFIERKSRKSFLRYVDRVVTVQDYDMIFDIPTIKISNGIDLEKNPLRTIEPHKGIYFLGVALLKRWHAFDRFIEGLGKYYKDGGREDIHFFIVGKNDSVENEYLALARKYNIEKRIHLEGPKEGKELDAYFDKADLAIGSLGFHRIGLTEGKPLKCIEYAARGIPFIYSNINLDFDDKNYVFRVPADDTPINVEEILRFLHNQKDEPLHIRESIGEKATWNYQMSIVYDEIKHLKQ